MAKPLKIFITYAHKDSEAKDELVTRLAVLKSKGLISIWHDNEINAGDTWRDAIFSNLDDSDILLYLVSAYSLDSESCNEELAGALNAKIRVIPIVLESCDWQHHQLSDFQALPDKGKPIMEWEPESRGWQNVVEGIRKSVTEMQSYKSESAEKRTLSDGVFQRGNFLVMLGQTDIAIEAYSDAIELTSIHPAYYLNRGVAYREVGDLSKALEDYNTAIQLKDDFAEAYNNRGRIHSNTGDSSKAFEDYNTAIRLNPNFAEAYNNRGVAYGIKGQIDKAIEDFDKAIGLNPAFADAYCNRGNAYLLTGDVDKAIEDYSLSIKYAPKDAMSYSNRGVAYLRKGKVDKTIEDTNKAIELDDKLSNAYYNRAEARLRLKEWDKAKSDLTTAEKLGMDIVAAFHNNYKNVETYARWQRVRLPEDIAHMLTQSLRVRFPKQQKILSPDGTPLESPSVVTLCEQLRNTGPPLGTYLKVKPSFGPKTSPTEAFVVDRKTRDNLIAAHPSSADILKPFLHGRDLRRWHAEPQEKWLIFTHKGITINEYPAILRHLENHRDALSERSGKQEWYELSISLDKSHRFSQPKLVCPNLYNHQTFAVDTAGFYCGDTCYLIPTEELWLCGLLNSRVVEWFYSQESNQLTIDYLRARSGYMQQIPIPDITLMQKVLIGKFVDYLIYLQQQPTINSSDLAYARDAVMLGYFERIIDGMVYESYLPDELHKSRKHLFQPLFDEQLPLLEDIQGDKMSACRDIFELLYEKTHPVAVNLFFLDSVKPVRVIEGKL